MPKNPPRAKSPSAGSSGYQELRDKIVELVSQNPNKAAIILTDWVKTPSTKKGATLRSPALKPKKAA